MNLAGMRVLLAEDNPTNQMVAVQMLESLDATVVLATDGAEAWDVLQNQGFDVALVDIEMPEISGIDLIRRVRALPTTTAELPMIALTAYVMREHRAAIDSAGADGIIAKPILSIETFGEEILKHIDSRRNRPVSAIDPTADAVPENAEYETAAEAGRGNEAEDQPGPEIDWDVYARLCSTFRGSAMDDLAVQIGKDIKAATAQISGGMERFDMSDIRAGTHVLISVAGIVGATRLQELSRCLNSAGHETDTVQIGRDGPELLEEANRVLDFVLGD
ncbi:MAG: response regulator [Pseudomonadota bacterium]